MKTNVVEKGKWERELEVEISAERIETELTSAYRKYQKRLEVPGFRKGKVPLRVIKARFGDSIRGEVISDLLPTFLEEATREAGLVPAAPPSISKLEHEPGQPLNFTATLDIWPEIEVENYEKLAVTKMTHEVTDEEIEEQLKDLQNRQASERSVERPLEKGDVLLADLQRVDDSGVPIIGERFEERRFLIGEEGAPSPDFEEALIGIQAGEERVVRFTYREDLPNEELAGTQDHFNVSAREVHERVLPELDDEFAKDVGAEYETLEDLRQHIGEQITQRWTYISDQRLRSELVDQLVEKNPFELPESMVENYLRSMQQDQQGAAHEHDHEHDHEHSDEERETATRRLKSYLLIESVRKQAEIEANDEDFEAYLAQRAEEIGLKAEDLKRSERLDDLRRELEEKKVFDLLIEKAEVKEEKA
ncbi:MAG: trigger factor [Gemmatimonadetes bacterium]|nr:trigger factor [Gemmatimonadota bacterium]